MVAQAQGGVEPFDLGDPDTQRMWWTDVGVHQNLTFPVHPDPISGMHCWHQAVRVRRPSSGTSYGDVCGGHGRAHEVYEQWLEKTRSADDLLAGRDPTPLLAAPAREAGQEGLSIAGRGPSVGANRRPCRRTDLALLPWSCFDH